MVNEKVEFKFRPYTKKELTLLYEMPDTRAFDAFIRPYLDIIGRKKGRYYTILQVEALIKCIGLPRKLLIDVSKDIKEFV